MTMLGEAKTLPDLESPRTFLQFLAFLRFLTARPKPTFVIATPWQATATAKNIIAHAKRLSHAREVPVHFLADEGILC
jgi:hypothetical protein